MDKDQITTTIVLDADCWQLLKRLAALRAAQDGGRPSASRLISKLVLAEAERERLDA